MKDRGGTTTRHLLIAGAVLGFLVILVVVYLVENAINESLGFPLGYIFFPIAVVVSLVSWIVDASNKRK